MARGRERDLAGGDLLAGADDADDLGAHALDGDVERLEHAGGQAFLLAEQAEQDVLRADVVVLELPRLFLGKDDDLAGSLCKSLEHVGYLLPKPLSSSTVARLRLARPSVDMVERSVRNFLAFFFGRYVPLDQPSDRIRAPGCQYNNGPDPLSGPTSRSASGFSSVSG